MSYQLMSHNMHDHGKNHGIKDLQKSLAGANAWKKNWGPGKVDGVYGPTTAGAVKRAKFDLGFPRVNNVADDTFIAIVEGKKGLPAAYKAIAVKRRGAVNSRRVMRAKALALAKSKLGVVERPAGSNIVEFSKWYGLTGPWCAMFVSWCYVGAKSKAFAKGQRYAYVPYILADAAGHKHGLSITGDPQPGDLVLFDWDGDGVPDHIGLFEKWNTKTHSSFTAIEGNTAVGNDSNGGEVMHRTDRKKSNVKAFIRVSS